MGKQVFSYTDIKKGLTPGTYTVEIKLKTSAYSADAAAEQAVLSIITIPALSVDVPEPEVFPVNYNIEQLTSIEFASDLSAHATLKGLTACKIDATHILVAYTNTSYNLQIKTFSIDESFAMAEIDSIEYTGLQYNLEPAIVQIDTYHYLWAAAGDGSLHGHLATIGLDASYNISVLNTLEPDGGVNSRYHSIAKINNTNFVLAHDGFNGRPHVTIFSIDGSYAITKGDQLYHYQYATTALFGYNSVSMFGLSHFVVAFTDDQLDGRASMFSLDGSYNITEVHEIEHDAQDATWNSIIPLDTEALMLAFTGNSADGYIKMLGVDGSFEISDINELEHDTSDGTYNSLCFVDSTHGALAYTGPDSDGFIKIFGVNGSYTISEIDAAEHDTGYAIFNKLFKLDNTRLVLAYEGASSSGHLKIFELD